MSLALTTFNSFILLLLVLGSVRTYSTFPSTVSGSSIPQLHEQEPSPINNHDTRHSHQQFISKRSSYATIELSSRGIKIDGRWRILRGGSLQWFRLAPEEWEDRILRFKAMGYNLIDMYVAWRNHEPEQGKYDFKTFDLVKFLALVKKHDLYVYFRPGPYICNELDGGGLPWWVRAQSDKNRYDPVNMDGTMNIRTDDKDFIDAVAKYFHQLNRVIKPFLHTNGGPIVLYGIENEFNWALLAINNEKLATLKDGTPERSQDVVDAIDAKAYMIALRDITVQSGIDVPITTCSGDGYLTGTFNLSGIVPFPNVYFELDNAEYNMIKLKTELDSSPNYKNYPLGVTETIRDNWVLKRLIAGGARLVSQFDIVGFKQEGRQNGMTFNAPLYKGPSPHEAIVSFITEGLKLQNLIKPGTGIFRVPVGLFPGTVDMNTAITANGLLRDKFYHIRRTNLMIDSFEEMLSEADDSVRTTFSKVSFKVDRRITVSTGEAVGVVDGDSQRTRVHYWIPLSKVSNESAFLSLVNEKGKKDLMLASRSINAFGMTFPVHSRLTIPFENIDNDDNSSDRDKAYDMFIPINIPIGNSGVTVAYSTSEILTFREWDIDGLKRTVLIVYNKAGSFGEIKLQTQTKMSSFSTLDDEMKISPSSESDFDYTFVYKHEQNTLKTFSILNNTHSFQVVAIDLDMAAKTWILPYKKHEIVLTNIDLVTFNGNWEIEQEIRNQNAHIYCISPVEPRFNALNPVSPYSSLIKRFALKNKPLLNMGLPLSLGIGETVSDLDGFYPTNLPSPRQWIQLGNQPEYLEKLNVSGGHVWYRALVTLNQDDLMQTELGLRGEFASDFVSIYVNGHYILTLFPIGIEIDSTSWDKYIGFKIPMSVWKIGVNIVSFKVEVWGAGSFAFPRGTLTKIPLGGLILPIPAFKLSLPSIGYDVLKGLAGPFSVHKKALVKWEFSPGLDGELYSLPLKPSIGDWQSVNLSFPWTITDGNVIWYKTVIDTSLLPSNKEWFAPVSLRLKGTNTKATIYLNGRLIGRWISDNEWLKRGNWATPVRDLWSIFISVDDIPLTRDMMTTGLNHLLIMFEDVGDSTQNQSAVINSIQIISSAEILVNDGRQVNLESRMYSKARVY